MLNEPDLLVLNINRVSSAQGIFQFLEHGGVNTVNQPLGGPFPSPLPFPFPLPPFPYLPPFPSPPPLEVGPLKSS